MRVAVKLTGPNTRQTGVFGGTRFKHGVAVIDGQPHEVGNLVTYLQRCFNVEITNADAIGSADGNGQANGNAQVHGAAGPQAAGVQRNDQAAPMPAGRPADGGSGEGAAAQIGDRLRKAIQQLDPATDDHWTGTGKPMLSIIEKFYGSSGVTRADVQAAIPGYDREAAKAAKAG